MHGNIMLADDGEEAEKCVEKFFNISSGETDDK